MSEYDKEKSNSEVDHPYLLRLIFREWHVVKTAPFAFVASAAIGGFLVYLLYNIFLIPGMTATALEKDASIQNLQQRLDEKPSGNQSEEVKNPQAEVEEQKVEFKKFSAHALLAGGPSDEEWPSLTDEQIKEWSSTLEPYDIQTITIYSVPGVDAEKLLTGLRKISDKIKSKVIYGAGSPDDDCEIEIAADNRIGPILLGLLNKLGVTKWDKSKTDTISPDVSIFIGLKSPKLPSSIPSMSASKP